MGVPEAILGSNGECFRRVALRVASLGKLEMKQPASLRS